MHISQEHRLTYKVGFQLVVNENIIAQHLVTAVVRIYLGCNKIGDSEIMFSDTGDKQTFQISQNSHPHGYRCKLIYAKKGVNFFKIYITTNCCIF